MAMTKRSLDPVLVRVGAAAMVRVDAASRAEVVLRHAGIEPVSASSPASNVMPPTSADTATAPRIRQYEQVQRRAVLKPSVNFTRKRTVPQWHTASISPVSFACIVKLSSFAEGWRDIMPQRRSGTSQLALSLHLL